MTTPSVPGALAPAAGVGVTLHDEVGLLPGTILRAEPGKFWFRLDQRFEGAERVWSAKRAWTFCVVQQPDGTWRDEDGMRRVDVGVRRVAFEDPTRRGVPGERSLEQLAAAVDRIEPRLLPRRWFPMTYLAIPSLLRSADELLAELAAYDGAEQERVAALHARLTALRLGFRRDD